MSATDQPSATGTTAQAASDSAAADDGSQHEHALVGAIGDDHFLENEFQKIGKGLQQAEGSHHIGATAKLNGGPDLAISIDQEGHDDEQALSSKATLCSTIKPTRNIISFMFYSAACSLRPFFTAEHSAMVREARAMGLVM